MDRWGDDDDDWDRDDPPRPADEERRGPRLGPWSGIVDDDRWRNEGRESSRDWRRERGGESARWGDSSGANGRRDERARDGCGSHPIFVSAVPYVQKRTEAA